MKERVAPYSKVFLTDFTGRHPDVFADFKNWIASDAKSLGNEELDGRDNVVVAEYLKRKLGNVAAGADGAREYHRVAVGILEFLLYPDVICPVVEAEIHDGRKRIDIVFDNAAARGFFIGFTQSIKHLLSLSLQSAKTTRERWQTLRLISYPVDSP